ncbi:hypothetical protein [Planococcus sp. CPCC 101016]|uniref:hypothetical protein n=1 Tax=Planococcus sp. CPCC 101016 TaxID=2599617 RepID=UPI0016494819|nr:hypothetical protein [Planococcus sp. CPCC 101016]
MAYDPRIWALELDKKKSRSSLVAPTSAGSFNGNGVLQPLLEKLKRLEGLAAGAGQ